MAVETEETAVVIIETEETVTEEIPETNSSTLYIFLKTLSNFGGVFFVPSYTEYHGVKKMFHICENLNEVHVAQVLTYLKFSKKKVCLLLNFYKKSLKDGIKRIQL
ncbi:MAG: GxxExxY protein [Bacteroidales bacterium]|nr:GxxExxY protein [Bacteroidales bacterium]